ncbi:hypothetical protein MVEN_00232300 [Mycena venus]|uniref:Phenol 2-monooxygenase n=1 Tax=Mycena venus TaxID=2733690 RepID=A0A8H7DC72_9AGAR|nr:hypothetical protein MVEN_00232300 [Mycena venus]
MPTTVVPETKVDVLVIGAGPAGLMCANALAKAGVNVRIVDQRPSKVAAGQADGIQPRTIEVFQSYGLADRLLKEGNEMHVAAFYNPGPNGGIELTDRVPDVTAPTARYPFEVTLHQGAIENIFLDSMKEMGVQVSRPMVPTQLDLDPAKLGDPNAYAARVVLKHLEPLEDGPSTEVVHAKFVVGTDGAHSWVRKRFDIAMEGSQTDYVWGVVDMIPQTDFPDIRHKTAIHSENGSCMIIPREGDMIRLYIQLEGKDAVDAVSGRVDMKRMGPHQLLEVASKSMRPYIFKTPNEFDWWTIYIIGQRVASQFSVDERVFIAGDACHTHSPKAGQGMNASMNDSHNLGESTIRLSRIISSSLVLYAAWKLVYVLRGWAGISLLKTYELERRKYAQDLIDFDVKFSGLFSGKPRTEINQNGVSHEDFPSGVPNVRRVHERDRDPLRRVGDREVLVRAADGRPIELQDMLPSNALFKLLVFTGDTATAGKSLDGVAKDVTALVQKFGTKVEVVTIVSATTLDKVSWRLQFWLMGWAEYLGFKGCCPTRRICGGHRAGNAYEAYGIDPRAGATVCVRPDGYVGMVTPLEELDTIAGYFESFLA